MFLILFCLTEWLLVSSMVVERPYYDLESVEHLFEEFIITHNKSYPHGHEKQKRFEIFKENVKEINYLNKVSEAAHGITQFTDMTEEEFAIKYNSCLAPPGYAQNLCRIVTDAEITTNQAPDSLDYRQKNAVSSIKNQNPCNSCWAFSSVGSLEAQYAFKYGQLHSLSAQQLMDCLKCSGHCSRGSFMTSAFSELMHLPGVEYDADYPYAHRDLRCQFDRSKAMVRVTGCLNYHLRDENKLKEALFQNGPIAIAIYSVPLKTYPGGIISVNSCPAGRPGHAVLLVGYGSEGGVDYWLIKNSWGPSWGEQGYLRITRGQNTCGLINIYAASATIA